MPGYWAPPPGNRKATFVPERSLAAPSRLAGERSASTASSRDAHTTARRSAKRRRPAASVKAASARSSEGSASSRSARRAVARSSEAFVRAESRSERRSARGRGRRRGGRLLDDDVGVRPADAEGVDAGPARAVRGPRRRPVGDEERRLLPIDLGVGLAEVQARRQGAVPQHLHDLDEARDTRRGVEVADVRLDGADGAEARALGEGAEGPGQARHLDGIAHGRPRPVALDVGDGVGRHAGDVERLGHGLGLPVDAGRQVADLPAPVVVHRRALDDGVDGVAVLERVPEPPQDHDAGPAPEDRALRPPVERAAVPVVARGSRPRGRGSPGHGAARSSRLPREPGRTRG